jgi:predicted transcriptional regulator
MKEVLISIQPKWCELIANGTKTVEVRKTRPTIETPFKCYIYQTVDGRTNTVDILENNLGKVIGEFVCDRIDTIRKRGIDDNFDYCYLSLDKWGNDDIEPEITAVKNSCVLKEDLNDYGKNSRMLYGWHISDLKIYDEPKELSEFKKINRECWYADLGLAKRDCLECKNEECYVSRPPQSWCYVEGTIYCKNCKYI